MPDRPVLGILRISPPKARELNLDPDQVIRGIVAEDGKSIEFLLGNVKQEIRSNLEKWKGKAVELKVTIDKNESGSSRRGAIVNPEASLYHSLKPSKRYLLHPKSLITLLSNPNYMLAGIRLRIPDADDIIELLFDMNSPTMQNMNQSRESWVHFP